MTGQMRRVAVLWMVPTLALTLAGCAADTSPKGVFSRTCSRCHSLDVPLGQSFSPEIWKAVVGNMSDHAAKRFGGPIPEGDQKTIVEYLTVNAGKR